MESLLVGGWLVVSCRVISRQTEKGAHTRVMLRPRGAPMRVLGFAVGCYGRKAENRTEFYGSKLIGLPRSMRLRLGSGGSQNRRGILRRGNGRS